jgi:FdrA protein
MVIANEVRKGFYLDSVALMRVARAVAALPGVEEAGLMIATAANKEILREAGVLGEPGAAAGPADLVIALRASDEAAAQAAMGEARRQLDDPRRSAPSGPNWRPRSLRGALQEMPDANLALISVPGDFAIAEARKALCRGLHVMIFSDNVPLSEEAALKREARDLGLLVMGPDCGTAIIGGVPMAFANAVPRGDIGIIGASGSGIQEVSSLIANAGCGISHAIGTGGRDLTAAVGGITTLMAIDLLDEDGATKHIAVISKPPQPDVARTVLDRMAKSRKLFTVCFVGGSPALPLPPNVHVVTTLTRAAESVLGHPLGPPGPLSPHGPGGPLEPAPREPTPGAQNARRRGKLIRGLFCGGTLCSEAQVVVRDAGQQVTSNVPISGAVPLEATHAAHALIDLGEDTFTRGRPHPMIEPGARDGPLHEAMLDASVGAVLLDVILGWGSHPDPAGQLVRSIAANSPAASTTASRRGPCIIVSVTGTEADPQVRSAQVRTLEEAGVIVAPSNARAAALALAWVR